MRGISKCKDSPFHFTGRMGQDVKILGTRLSVRAGAGANDSETMAHRLPV